jgi:DNA-binding NarL/FixJ family response regulator
MLKRAFLIDNDAVFRLGLSRVLADEFAIETVGSRDLARDCSVAINAARADVLMLDPAGVGRRTAAWVHELLSPPREFAIVMLIAPQPSAGIRELIALGAEGFLLKPFGIGDLAKLFGALRRDADGSAAPAVARPVPAAPGDTAQSVSLNEREMLVVRRTADGRSSAQIAEEFGISVKTAERYRRSILSKLKLHSVAELTKFAVREGYTAL